MGNDYTENALVQESAGNLLREELGWRVELAYNREELGECGTYGRRSYKDILLERELRAALRRLNPWMTPELTDTVLRKLKDYSITTPLLEINAGKADLLRDGIKVPFLNQGRREERTVRLIDFENPENNRFLALKELWIQGEVYLRRADIVCFVNGFPLVFVELKKTNVDVRDAYTHNYRDYCETIPQLFHFNAFIVLSNGLQSKVGTLGSKYEFFHEWKRLREEDEGSTGLDTLLRGMCRKENLLDLVENFIIFDDSSGTPVKILARNHQYLGVNAAVDAYAHRRERQGKLGVFWHTQGSGKSYSMVFLARKILRKFEGSPTIVVLTDRDELNKQISTTFAGCELLSGVPPKVFMAESGEDLYQRLSRNPSFIFTLIQKFNSKRKPLTPDYDILIMSDEAHRSQYGIFAEQMRRWLRWASCIGFTGTPLLTNDSITERTFGNYISVYDFKRAVEDGATVPLYYENRGDKIQGLTNPELTDEIIEAIESAELDDAQRERVEHDFRRELHLLRAEPRQRMIARDFVQHYSDLWTTGKAMFVCLDKVSCVRMYNYVQEYWAERIAALEQEVQQCRDQQEALELQRKLDWMRKTEMAVVVSQEQNEQSTFTQWGLDITPHRRKMQERELDREFKDPDSPFRIVFVCAMWMTGFDVKALSCLYLDKPMKAHTLMQAIARANRVAEGKSNGLITDYIGIIRALRKALADYTVQRGGNGGADPTIDREELTARLRQLLTECVEFLKETGVDLPKLIAAEGFDKMHRMADAAESVLARKEGKATLSTYVAEIRRLFRYTRPGELTHEEVDRVYAVSAIRDQMKPKQPDRDTTNLQVRIHEIMSSNLVMEERTGDGTKLDISKINFERLVREFAASARPFTIMRDIQALLEDRLRRMLRVNSEGVRMGYYEHYLELIKQYNESQDRAAIEKIFAELLQLSEKLSKEEKRYVRMGFDNDEQLALYDLLFEANLSQEESRKLRKAAVTLFEVIHKTLEEMHLFHEKESTRAHVRNTIKNTLWEALPDCYPNEVISSYADRVYEYVLTHYGHAESPYGPAEDAYAMAAERD
ncbi:MAG: type I restriction endonuclease subunit R [Akkermansia sp.]